MMTLESVSSRYYPREFILSPYQISQPPNRRNIMFAIEQTRTVLPVLPLSAPTLLQHPSRALFESEMVCPPHWHALHPLLRTIGKYMVRFGHSTWSAVCCSSFHIALHGYVTTLFAAPTTPPDVMAAADELAFEQLVCWPLSAEGMSTTLVMKVLTSELQLISQMSSVAQIKI